jgi:hypothetical protein
MILVRCFTVALIMLTLSCKDSNPKFINPASYPNLKKQQLGESSYSVKYPSTMFIDEARGKEGQIGYGLWQIDSLTLYRSPSGFIEIEHGRPIGWEPDCDIPIDKVSSNFLDGTITWTICKSETGKYFSAVASRGKLSLNASSETRSGLDSMIGIISTLKSH